MAFSRNSLAAAVAGTLSLAVLTGCPATPPTTPSPSVAPTTAPGATAAPTTEPGATAAPTTAPGATTAPNANASPSLLTPTTLRGKVYDVENAAVSTGAKVSVKSLNPSNPFETTVDVIQGSYVVNNVPAGVQLEITASRTGWTSRTRVETLLPLTSTQPNIVNFGGEDAADTEGAAYFISKYPEITTVSPADDAENVDPTKLSVVLTLSEPLDSVNQRRFANAVRVWPVNTEAGGNALANLEDNTSSTPAIIEVSGNPVSPYNYVVKQGSIYADDDANRATVTWDAAGTVATLTFNAPLRTGETDPGAYNIGLVAGTEQIKDAENNVLGTDETGALNSAPTDAGELIRNAFRETDLSAEGTTTAQRWASTHDDVSSFELAEDSTDPTLQSVSVVEVTGETRIQLTFSEPMAAFAGSGVLFSQNTVRDLANYSFAVADDANALNDVDLEGDSTNTETGTTFGGAEDEEFTFEGNSNATIELSPTDPKTVRIVLPENFFADDLVSIKARAVNVEDPAGNAITSTQADAQVKTGNI